MQIILVFPIGNRILQAPGKDDRHMLYIYGDNAELITSMQITSIKAQKLKERLDATGALKCSHEGRMDTEYVYEWTPPMILQDLELLERHHRPIR